MDEWRRKRSATRDTRRQQSTVRKEGRKERSEKYVRRKETFPAAKEDEARRGEAQRCQRQRQRDVDEGSKGSIKRDIDGTTEAYEWVGDKEGK